MNQQSLEITRRSTAAKLHPSNIHTSTFVRSLIAYLVGEIWTEPYIEELICLPRGELLARETDGGSYLRVLCTRQLLVRAVLALSYALDLTPKERSYILQRIPSTRRAR